MGPGPMENWLGTPKSQGGKGVGTVVISGLTKDRGKTSKKAQGTRLPGGKRKARRRAGDRKKTKSKSEI